MTSRRLLDDIGQAYDVPQEAIDQATLSPPDPDQAMILRDPATGEVFALPRSWFNNSPGPGRSATRGAQAQANYPYGPTPGYQERLIEILLEDCTLNIPGAREKIALLVGPILAIGKISSEEEYRIAQLEVENLIRSLYSEIVASSDDQDALGSSLYIMDQIEFFARWQLRRSIAYDNRPNEREWLTVQSIHQKQEYRDAASSGSSGGALSSLSRLFGKKR